MSRTMLPQAAIPICRTLTDAVGVAEIVVIIR